MNRHSFRHRPGMTLLDLVAAMGICLFLSTMVFGGLFGSREQANRIKCANNLRQIGLAALMYSNAERTGAFPRTYFNRASPKLIIDTTGYGKPNSFDPAIGGNNVTASFYLLLKTQDITPAVFVCPSTKGVPGFGKGAKIGVQDSSNWEAIPGNLTYSYSCPFPMQDAIAAGWKFNNTLGSDRPLAADLNPGGDEMLKLTPGASKDQMKAGNSFNHKREGQNVIYCDGHVEFQPIAFCGAADYKVLRDIRDNIYTCGGPSATKGGDGVDGMPVSPIDSVLLPVGNADAPATQPAAGSGAAGSGGK